MLELKLDDSLLDEYLTESREQLAAVETDLLAIKAKGADIDEERVTRVFRAIHTINRASGFFDLTIIGELAHHTANVLALIHSKKMAPTRELINVLLHAVDCLSGLIDNAEISNQADIAGITDELAQLYEDNRLTTVHRSGGKAGKPANQHGARLHVLLVEDDFACRLLLQTFLFRYGECHIAVNGREAVEAFRTALEAGKSYDLICMDIMMPEMDGREAVRQVRALEEARGILSTCGAKIFMVTTVQEMKEVFLCFKELCDAYLLKPVDLGKLLNQMKLCQLVQ